MIRRRDIEFDAMTGIATYYDIDAAAMRTSAIFV